MGKRERVKWCDLQTSKRASALRAWQQSCRSAKGANVSSSDATLGTRLLQLLHRSGLAWERARLTGIKRVKCSRTDRVAEETSATVFLRERGYLENYELPTKMLNCINKLKIAVKKNIYDWLSRKFYRFKDNDRQFSKGKY